MPSVKYQKQLGGGGDIAGFEKLPLYKGKRLMKTSLTLRRN